MRRHAKASSAGSISGTGASRSLFGCALVCAVSLCAFLGSGAPAASAASPKGVTGFFGANGSAAGQMSTPRGVDINQTSGDVYVVDAGNRRVDLFDSSGGFLRAFGQDVIQSGPDDNGSGYEICIPASGDVCKEGGFAATGGALGNPQGIAVDQITGNLYVTDQGNRRVEQFDEEGHFLRAFGQDVVESGPGNSGTGFEVCVAANGDVCKTGVTGSTGGAFGSEIGYLAIAPVGAPNAGDVLVADRSNSRVQEFGPSGSFVRAFGFDVESGGGTGFEVCTTVANCKAGEAGSGNGQFAAETPTRVAEDAAGNLYTVEPTTNFRVQQFTLPGNVVTAPAGAFDTADIPGSEAATPTDVAIDPATSDVLIARTFPAGSTPSCPITGEASAKERRVLEVSSAGTLQATQMACAGIDSANGLAARTSASIGDVYVSSTTTESRIYVLNTGMPVPPADGLTSVTGITAHSATISGFVNPQGPSALAYGLHTTYHVAFKRSADSTFVNAPAEDIDAGHGTNNIVVNQQLIGLEAGTSYDVQIVATKGFDSGSATTTTSTFTTPAAGAEVGNPTVTTAATETGAKAALYGTVSPNSKATTYHFEYGTTTSYGTNVPVPNEAVGSGASAVPVVQYVTGLLPATTYHFRIVAQNTSGGTASPDQTFTTPMLGEALPDGRAWEQVSRNDKRPTGTITRLLSPNIGFQAAPDGNSTIYNVLNGLSDSTAGGNVDYLAKRATPGWQSTQLSPPALVPTTEIGFGFDQPNQTVYSSPDLSCGFVTTFAPLTSDVPAEDIELGVENLYRYNADGTYTLITAPVPPNPTLGSGVFPFQVYGASADCSHVLFTSQYQLLANAPAPRFNAVGALYEWANGVLRSAYVRPDGSEPAFADEASPGSSGPSGGSTVDVFSVDGSRAIFTTTSDQGGDSGKPAIFVRKNGTSTVDVSQSQTDVPGNGKPAYQIASKDGSLVFFLARYGLAPNGTSSGATSCDSQSSNATGAGCDLYSYDLNTDTLTDLSADANPVDTEGAGVVGVLDASNDGSHVYFAARGQLVGGQGNTQGQNLAGSGSYNVYLSHNGLSFVGVVKQSDTQGIGGVSTDIVSSGNSWVADATPNGAHLLFISKANVNGYASGGEESEAYLYTAASGSTVCVSCRLDGLPAVPNSDLETGGQIEPIAPANQVESGQRAVASAKPVSVSDDGSRVFFKVFDAIAPGAVSGDRNLYEWENGQVHLLATGPRVQVSFFGLFTSTKDYGEFLGTTGSGNDVFLTTESQLVPQDFDNTMDVYDARAPHVPGETVSFAAPSRPLSCNPLEGQCQGTPTPQPGTDDKSTSEGFSGVGNPPASKPKPRHRHKTKKHKAKRHNKRTAHNNGRASR